MSQEMQNEIFEETSSNIKKQTRSFLSDGELQNQINELSKQREGISLEIKKLRNRLNASVFKAKKKAGSVPVTTQDSLISFRLCVYDAANSSKFVMCDFEALQNIHFSNPLL